MINGSNRNYTEIDQQPRPQVMSVHTADSRGPLFKTLPDLKGLLKIETSREISAGSVSEMQGTCKHISNLLAPRGPVEEIKS